MRFRGMRLCPYCGDKRCPNAKPENPQPQDCPEFDYAAWLAALKDDEDDNDDGAPAAR